MKKTLILFALALCVTSASAQNVLQHFELDELGSTPAEIFVSTNYQAIIEFPGEVGTPTSAGLNKITVETDPEGIVRVRANRPNVRTDLVVTVNGKTAMFSLEPDSGATSNRRYVVRQTEPKPPFSGTSQRSGAGGPVSLPSREELLPEDVTFDTNIMFRRGQEVVIQYALANDSDNPIAADVNRLQVVHGDSRIPYTLARATTSGGINRVLSGEVEYGTILIQDPPEEGLELSWSLVEIGPGRDYVIRRMIGEGLARLP